MEIDSTDSMEINRHSSREVTVGWSVNDERTGWFLLSLEQFDVEGRVSSERELLIDSRNGLVVQPYTRNDMAENRLQLVIRSDEKRTETRYFSLDQKNFLSCQITAKRFSCRLPFFLQPGQQHRIAVEALIADDNHSSNSMIINCKRNQRILNKHFRSDLTSSEIRDLERRAANFIRKSLSMHEPDYRPCLWFYRNKTRAYFDEIFFRRSGIMEPYLKDNNGDPASAINGRLKGLFFAVSVMKGSGIIPPTSPFGPVRLCIKSWWMFMMAPNLYFADFYCNNKPHYVTLVMTRDGSPADLFCIRNHLQPLDVFSNPFLQLTALGECLVANSNILVEVFFTENINITEVIGEERCGVFVTTPSSGTSKPDGIPKRDDCTTCNLYSKP